MLSELLDLLLKVNEVFFQYSDGVGLGRIFGSSNICSAMHECQISDTNFYPRTFGTFPNSSGDIMIYGQSDILSKYTDSFSLSSLNSTSMEGKILVKNPHEIA